MSADSRIRRQLCNTGEIDRLLRRIRCQIEFGRAIDGGHFAAALDQAESLYRTSKSYRTHNDLAEAVARAEALLSEVAREAKSFTVHLVGHGHIDMNWMWSWPETCATTHDTFASVLALMEEYPELTYSQSQASVYALVEKYHPEMFEQIRQRVKEGRWEVAAVHWVEGDKNLASGEALAHHLLYTRRYFEEKFGLKPEDVQLDWEPDTFGHCNTLPGILRQGSVKYYYCCRPGGGQEHLRVGEARPPLFWWQSPDGSRVLVNRETTWYNSYVEIGDNFALPAAAFWRQTGIKDWLNVYGIGNHGGGPTREEIDFFLETRDWPCWPNVIFGTAQGWFRKIEPQCADLPVIDHELNYEFTGCYTSQSAIKKANRYGENYCVEAETLATLEFRIWNLEWPETHSKFQILNSKLREAWLNVLFNQFHDILPGSGVAATRHHALGLFQETGAITGAIKRNALQAMARELDTASLLPDTSEADDERALLTRSIGVPPMRGAPASKELTGETPVLHPNNSHPNSPFEAGAGQGAGESGISRASGGGKRFRPVMIYNPCAWVRSELVQVSLYDLEPDIPDDQIVALDEAGRAHPTLNISGAAGGAHDWGHRRTDLLFHAKDIPALGYRTFLFCEGSPDAFEDAVETLSETGFRTPHMQVRLSKYFSGLDELIPNSGDTLTTGYEPLGQWELVMERPKGMSAWQISYERFGEAAIPGHGPSFRVLGGRRNEATDLRKGRSPAVLTDQLLRVPDTTSTIRLKTFLGGAQPRVDWLAEIDWREIGDDQVGIPGLRVDFENALRSHEDAPSIFETPFGTVARPPSDAGYLDSDPDVPSLRFVHVKGEGGKSMSLLQDSKYGFSQPSAGISMRVLHSTYEPDHAPEVAKSTLRYALVFHDAEPTQAELVRLGAAFNHPLIVVPVLLQTGSQPTKKSFVEVLTESVVLSTMKPAEDGKGIVLRLVNYADKDARAKVRLDPEFVQNFAHAVPVDLIERPVGEEATWRDGVLEVEVGANSFASVMLK